MFSPLPLLMRTVRCGKYVSPDWRKKCKQKVQVIRDSCHAEKTDEIRGIRQHFQTVWLWWWWVRWWCVRKHWARQKTCFVFFPKHFSVGVGGRKGSEHHTHTHTQDGWSHRTTQWLHRHCPDKHSRFPPLRLFILFTLLALRTLVTMKTHFFGLVKVTWLVFWRNLKENKVCASIMT